MTDRKAQDISSEEKRQCNSKTAIIATESGPARAPSGSWQEWIVNKTNIGGLFSRPGMLRYNTACYSQELSRA
jgi:hypothetical protein